MPLDKLNADQKKAIVRRVQELDPCGDIVILTPDASYSGGTVAYGTASGLTLHEEISRLTDEEYVRALLVVRLVKELKYPADAIELEATYTIGRPSPTKAQIDVKVLDKRKDPSKPTTYMIVEAKRPLLANL